MRNSVEIIHQSGQARLQCSARVGKDDAAAVAVQQMQAEFLFHQLHLPAERGLRHPQFVGRTGETPQFGDAQEIAELADVHG